MTYLAVGVMFVTSLGLLAFGLNLLYLSLRSLRMDPSPTGLVPAGAERPVCVQLPIYNERHVAERVLDAACRLDWPRDRLEIQVLDDSDDDTTAVLAQAVDRWRRRGVLVTHVRRGVRTGYKAGALAHGLALTEAPFIAIFDADFVPPPDFLRRMLDAFDDDRLAFVQARWGHLNESYSLFTRLQGLAIDYHFLVEQTVRFGSGMLANFNGTAGVWRRAAIEDAGGWSAATLTEDLDISYRAQLRGWTVAYRESMVVPEELPVAVPAFRHQQGRWATGSFQCARRHLGPVLRSRLSARIKWQALMHLLAYGVGILMLLQLLCYPVLLWGVAIRDPLVLARFKGPAGVVITMLQLVGMMGVAPTAGYVIAQVRRGRGVGYGLVGFAAQLLGAAMMLAVLFAFFRAFGRGGTFVRTPKHRIVAAGQEWRDSAYAKAWDPIALLEGAIGLGAALIAVEAIRLQVWLVALYASLFAAGLLAVAGWSLVQSLQVVTLRTFGRRALQSLAAGGRLTALLVLPAALLGSVALIGDPFEDGYHHWLVAATLATTGALHDPLFGMEDTWLPAYHLVAAATLKVFGFREIGWLKAVNIGFGLASLALVYRLAGNPRRGRLALVMLALNPIFWLTATSIVAEPLLTALLLAATAAALSGWTRLAAVLAVLACATGTKAWIWVVAAAAIPVGEHLLGMPPRKAIRWALPAVALLVVLQLGFEPATHSAARAAVESASAVSRGSVSGDPWGRLAAFAGYFVVATLPLLALAPFGAAAELRSGGTARLRLLYLPAALYLVAVAGLVGAGVYTGSHRYYYPALPALALLGAAALDRIPEALSRIRTAAVSLSGAAAALIAVAYVPVAISFAAGNAGLAAAGTAAGHVPGRLFTDSPVAAYASGKPPAEIVGSKALPDDSGAAVEWLRARGVTTLVVEDVDYYRSAQTFPDLARGEATPPFAGLGDQHSYQAPGGKIVHAYTLDSYQAVIDPGVDAILTNRTGAPGKTGQLQKGVVLDLRGKELTGEGMGFGVPVVRYDDGWVYSGSATIDELSIPGHPAWRKTFALDRMEQYDADTGVKSYRAVPSRGRVEVSYAIEGNGLRVTVRALDLAPGFLQLGVLNEQSAIFDDFADPTQTRRGPSFGIWAPASGSWSRLRSGAAGLEWSVPAIDGATLFAGRELQPPVLDWAGLDYLFGPDFSQTEYLVTLGKAR